MPPAGSLPPGLIDLHTHVYDGVLNNGANPDVVGVNQGVTTVVDGGSAGQALFAGFPRYVVPAARTTVYCFLHIGSFGLAVMPELNCPEEINTDATEAVIRNHPELIRGVKLRIVAKAHREAKGSPLSRPPRKRRKNSICRS